MNWGGEFAGWQEPSDITNYVAWLWPKCSKTNKHQKGLIHPLSTSFSSNLFFILLVGHQHTPFSSLFPLLFIALFQNIKYLHLFQAHTPQRLNTHLRKFNEVEWWCQIILVLPSTFKVKHNILLSFEMEAKLHNEFIRGKVGWLCPPWAITFELYSTPKSWEVRDMIICFQLSAFCSI